MNGDFVFDGRGMILIPADYLIVNQFAYSEPVPIVVELREIPQDKESIKEEEKTQPDAILSEIEGIKEMIVAKAEENGIDSDLMLNIAECESHFKNDAIHHNNNQSIDIGIFQLNDIHGLSAEDRLDSEKNIDYAIKLIKRNGTKDWSASQSCWQKYL